MFDPLTSGQDDYVPTNLNQYATVNGASIGYDGNGNLNADGVNTYQYDAENRLTSVTTPDKTIEYWYDGFGRRVRQEEAGAPYGYGDDTVYRYDGSQVIEEESSTYTVEIPSPDQISVLVTTTSLQLFVYGPGLDRPIRKIGISSGFGNSYYHFDALGSVVALSDGGLLSESYAYGPYGQVNHTSEVRNPYLYTGRRYDVDTGLYFYRNRYYHAALGRFLEPDPIGYESGLNLYLYVNGNPTNFVDPLGLFQTGPNTLNLAEQGLGSIDVLFGGTEAGLTQLHALDPGDAKFFRQAGMFVLGPLGVVVDSAQLYGATQDNELDSQRLSGLATPLPTPRR